MPSDLAQLHQELPSPRGERGDHAQYIAKRAAVKVGGAQTWLHYQESKPTKHFDCVLVVFVCRFLHWSDTNRSAIEALDYVGGQREVELAQEGDEEGGGENDRSKLFNFSGIAPAD